MLRPGNQKKCGHPLQPVVRILLVSTLVAVTAGTQTQLVAQKPSRRDIQIETTTVQLAGDQSFVAEYTSFRVPENRGDKNSRTIRLNYIRLKSKAHTIAAPLIFLAGGPGVSATKDLKNPIWLKILEQRDVILFDQRGSGTSQPDIKWKWNGSFPKNVFLSQKQATEHFRIMGERAKQEFANRGVDLRGYTVVESANDLEELCRVLGGGKVSLLAHSWGTHLALEFIRLHEDRLENVILCGVAGPDHLLRLPATTESQFNKLSLAVAQDSEISKQIPNLVDFFTQLNEQIDGRPVQATIRNPDTGEPLTISVGAFGLKWIIFRDLNDPRDHVVFPRMLVEVKNGNTQTLNWFVQKRIQLFLQIDGMTMAMRNASGASPERRSLIASQSRHCAFGSLVNFPFLETRDQWQLTDLGDEFRLPIISDVRTLFVSGKLDSSTPPSRAEEVRLRMSNSTHIVVRNAGHDQLMTAPGIPETMNEFLSGKPIKNLDFSLPPVHFAPLQGPATDVQHPALR